MLHTTLCQIGIISGRSILAIGLSVGAMTSLTSAVKAEEVIVNNLATGSLV